jgi:hypothetical protein
VRAVELLRQLPDDGRAGRVGKTRELAQMFLERLARAGPLERSADEQGALDRRLDSDEIAGDRASGLI